jgi:hypothetical protein
MRLGLQSVKETNRLKSSFRTVILEEEVKEEEEENWTPPFHFLNSLVSSFLHQR